jgi:hypothetical protein
MGYIMSSLPEEQVFGVQKCLRRQHRGEGLRKQFLVGLIDKLVER